MVITLMLVEQCHHLRDNELETLPQRRVIHCTQGRETIRHIAIVPDDTRS